MHDAQALLAAPEQTRRGFARRGCSIDLDLLADLVGRRKDLSGELDKLRTESKRLAGASGQPASREAARALKDRLQQLEAAHRKVNGALTELLLALPNLPSEQSPDGGPADAVELRRVGEPVQPEPPIGNHADFAEAAGLLDPKRSAKLSGARFSVASGALAVLQRALATFFLDLHVNEHGYQEYTVPTLVSRETMTGTGQLPKFEEDLFRTTVGDRELFLIPTAEVPLTNLYAGETLTAANLPLALTARTPCFRSEAGSYGKDARGIFRLHEFEKVELVRICRLEEAAGQLDLLVSHAERCLQLLELSYRVVALAAGDLGFSARTTLDIEVWLPGQQQYREISSCSDCGQFQGRRARIRVLDGGRKAFAATLNGSGLPIGRTVIAILEQHRLPDGSVRIPDVLVPHTRFDRIHPDGSVRPAGAPTRHVSGRSGPDQVPGRPS